MRFFTFLLVSSVASAAVAQAPAPVTQTKTTSTVEIGYSGRDGKAVKTETNKTVTTTVTPAVHQPIAQPTPLVDAHGVPIDESTIPVTEIGYDAKVKRDPNGKVIGEKTTTTTTVTNQEKTLRNDRKLRSDSSMSKKNAPAAPPAPTVTQTTTTVKESAVTRAPGAAY